MNFRKDGENGRENSFNGYLVGEIRGQKTSGAQGIFSSSPPKINPPHLEIFMKRKLKWEGGRWKMTHLPLIVLMLVQLGWLYLIIYFY